MNNEKNLPVLKNTKNLAVTGQQLGLIARGLDILNSISSDSQDDNNAARQWELGCEYLKGRETDRDYEQAFYWFHNAAEQGHAEAQFALGSLYATGEGVGKNELLAKLWYRKAAAQGHAWAQRYLENVS